MLPLTHHAQARLQQRGIPSDVIESLLDFGHEIHDHRGSLICYFDRQARARLRAAWGQSVYKRIEPHLDAYAVIGDNGDVITVGHRTRRISRN
jgi:hypothetical protein